MQSRNIRQGRMPGTASLGLHTHSAKLTLPLILSLCWWLTRCQLRQYICIMRDHIWGESDSLPGTKKESVRILKRYWNLLAPSSSFLGVPTKRVWVWEAETEYPDQLLSYIKFGFLSRDEYHWHLLSTYHLPSTLLGMVCAFSCRISFPSWAFVISIS